MKSFFVQIIEAIKEHPALAGILVTGFLLRLSGIFWGIPFPDPLEGDYHPDERIVIRGAVEFPGHIFTNEKFYYPTFFHYFLGIITFPLRLFFDDIWVPQHGELGPQFYYVVTVIGRLCSVLVGTGAIFLTYLLAKDIFDKKRGVLASAFLALTFYHSNNSSFATTDVFTSFFLVLFLLALRQAFLEPTAISRFVFAGMALGLLVGTKYTGALASWAIVVMYGNVLIQRFRNNQKRPNVDLQTLHLNLLLCGVTALAIFLLTTPGIVFQFQAVIDSILKEASTLGQRSMSRLDIETWKTAFQETVLVVGYPLAGLCILGLFFPLKKNVYEISFLTILVIFFVYFEASLVSRYVILVTPLMVILASHGVWSVYECRAKGFRIVGASAMAFVMVYSFGYCIEGAYERFHDTRTQSAHFVHNHIPSGTSIGVGYTSEKYKKDMSWRRPKINSSRYQVMDFLDYPEIVVLTSWDLTNIEKTLKSTKISRDYILGEQYRKEWWGFSPPSPRIFQFYHELLNRERSPYELIAKFEKTGRLFNFGEIGSSSEKSTISGSPDVRIYRASFDVGKYHEARTLLSMANGMYTSPYTTRRSYYSKNPKGYFFEEVAWRLEVQDDNQATLVYSTEHPDRVRVRITQAETNIPWHIQVARPSLGVQATHRYAVQFQARADRPRAMRVAVSRRHGHFENLGLYRKVELTPEWLSYEEEFVATADDFDPRVHFDMGESVVPVEVTGGTVARLDATSGEQDSTRQSVSVGNSRHTGRLNNILVEPDLPDTYYVEYQFNALGCRGRDYSIPKVSPEGQRLLVLGDSWALGAGVHEADTLTSQLEYMLNQEDSAQFSNRTHEVINCGVSGYGTRDERNYYETLVSKYQPDLTLLVMTPDDDRSWIEDAKNTEFSQLKIRQNSFVSWSSYDEILFHRRSPDYSESLQEVAQLNQLVQAEGGRLVVVVFRNTQHHAWAPLLQQVREAFHENTVPVLDLGEFLLVRHPEEDLIVHDQDKHPNEIAHRIAAQGIRDFLKHRGLLKLPRRRVELHVSVP